MTPNIFPPHSKFFDLGPRVLAINLGPQFVVQLVEPPPQ